MNTDMHGVCPTRIVGISCEELLFCGSLLFGCDAEHQKLIRVIVTHVNLQHAQFL